MAVRRFMEQYASFVRSNRQWLTSVESAANTLTWLLPERFASSELAPELLSSVIGLFSVLNQHIADTPAPNPHASRADTKQAGGSAVPWALLVAVVKETEVLGEIAAETYLGEQGKWQPIACIEAVKALLRILILHKYGYKMLLDGGQTANDDAPPDIPDQTDSRDAALGGQGGPNRFWEDESGRRTRETRSMYDAEGASRLNGQVGRGDHAWHHMGRGEHLGGRSGVAMHALSRFRSKVGDDLPQQSQSAKSSFAPASLRLPGGSMNGVDEADVRKKPAHSFEETPTVEYPINNLQAKSQSFFRQDHFVPTSFFSTPSISHPSPWNSSPAMPSRNFGPTPEFAYPSAKCTAEARDHDTKPKEGGTEKSALPQWLKNAQVAAEILHIFRPLVYVLLVRKYGKKSWRPWLLSAAMDLSSLALTWKADNLMKEMKIGESSRDPRMLQCERDEIRRRQMLLALYLMRSPCFETVTRKPLTGIQSILKPLPLIGTLAEKASDLLMGIQSYYFYTAAS